MILGLLFSVQMAFAAHTGPQAPFQEPAATRVSSTEKPESLKGIGITEKLGAQLNLDEIVRDENGNQVPLKSFFSAGRPVIFSLVYYSCPGLCNFHLNGLIEGLQATDWSAGQKFELVALSFDAKENSDLAKAKKATYLKLYNRAGTENGFHFLTADESTIAKIASTVGFDFKWDESENQWAHGSAAIMLSPDGKVTRYLHGILFDPGNIKLALNEAGRGQVGSFVDQMVMYCFKYDPKQSKYVLYAFRLVQLGGGLMIILLGFLLIPTWLRNRRQNLGT